MEKITIDASEYEKKIVTVPNVLSFLRICLIPVIVWLYCGEYNYVWAGYILLLSGVTDMVDGYIARHFHMVSNLGKVLDPIADKLTQGAMLLCLTFRFPLMVVPLALLLTKEIFMGISGILVIQKTGHVYGADWHGKAATCLLYGMMMLHVFWHEITSMASMLSILVCTLMIGFSFGLYARHNIGLIKSNRKH